jgi:hypothetical protein
MRHSREAIILVLKSVDDAIKDGSSSVRKFFERKENTKFILMSAPSADSIMGNLPPGVKVLGRDIGPGRIFTSRALPFSLN